MRTTSVMRFVVLGGVGFGVGGAIAGVSGATMPLGFFVMGALGGASLGLATSDKRSIATLALTGALGFGLGYVVAIAIVLLLWDPFGDWFVGAVGGLVGGASLGVTFRTWGEIVLLAVVGTLGFGIGWEAAGILSQPLVEPGASSMPLWQTLLFMTMEGAIGGASLGAALGYLEYRKLVEEQRPRVR